MIFFQGWGSFGVSTGGGGGQDMLRPIVRLCLNTENPSKQEAAVHSVFCGDAQIFALGALLLEGEGWRQPLHCSIVIMPDMAIDVGAKFIADTVAADPENVKQLPSGMAFRVLDPGQGTSGLSPNLHGQCSVHYEGTLINGTVFDSSYKRGTPAEFAPSQVIPGWTEALQFMTEGEKWEVFIPMELGYGVEGSPPEIPGRSALVFTIELLAVLGDAKQGTVAKRNLARALGEEVVEEQAQGTAPPSAAAADDDSDDDVPYGIDDLDNL